MSAAADTLTLMAGMSTRAIAPVVGASQKTINRDVRQVSHLTHQNETPESVATSATATVDPAPRLTPEEPSGQPGDSRAPLVVADVEVSLCRCHRRVPHEFLDDPDVRTAAK